jgi:hypothetical protein
MAVLKVSRCCTKVVIYDKDGLGKGTKKREELCHASIEIAGKRPGPKSYAKVCTDSATVGCTYTPPPKKKPLDFSEEPYKATLTYALQEHKLAGDIENDIGGEELDPADQLKAAKAKAKAARKEAKTSGAISPGASLSLSANVHRACARAHNYDHSCY